MTGAALPICAPAVPALAADTLWQLVERRAETTPDAALLLDDLGRALTAAGLRDAAAATAAGLLELGVDQHTVVSWQLPTSLEAAVLVLACARLGIGQNPIVPTLREREVSFIVDQVGTGLLAVPGVWRGFDHHAMATEIAAARGTRTLLVDHRAAAAAGELGLPTGGAPLPPVPAGPVAAGPAPAGPERPVRWAYYTSGTTAAPKGVLHTDASVMAAASSSVASMRLGPDDLYPIAFPIAHIGGTVMLAAALASGARLLLIDTFDPATSPLTMAAHGATILGSATPFLRAYLAAQADRHQDDRHQDDRSQDDRSQDDSSQDDSSQDDGDRGRAALFPRLRVAVSGGAAKPAGLHREIADGLGGRGLVSSWGMTEFPLATHGTLHDTDEDLASTEGRPTSGVEVRVVGPDGRVCLPGAEGELLLRGPQMFAGYLAAAAAEPEVGRGRRLDERRSRPAELFDEDGFLRTGDVGAVGPRGHVRILGRRKDIVIRNAENISASEVEEVLATHPAVSEAAVIALPDPRTGERCCAVITLAPGTAPVGLTDLARHCEHAGLARYKIPEQVEIVDALPRTDMGKIAKAVLRNRFQP